MSVRTSFHVIYGINYKPTKAEKRRFFDHLEEKDLWEKAKPIYVSGMDGDHIYFGHSFFNSGTDYDGFDGDCYQHINTMGPFLEYIEETYIKKFKEILPEFADWVENREFSLHALINCS